MVIDAHIHLNSFPKPNLLVLPQGQKGILINTGFELETLFQPPPKIKNCTIYQSLGVHPWIAAHQDIPADFWPQLNKKLKLPNTVAIGEIGLDKSNRCRSITLKNQVVILRQQLELANSHELPVILHNVRQTQALFQTIREVGGLKAGGIIHDFHGSKETLRQALDLQLDPSFGIHLLQGHSVTLEALHYCPIERLHIESDAPFRPLPNESNPFIRSSQVLALVSQQKNNPIADLTQQLYSNLKSRFPKIK